ncbi:SGS domain-containing protein [Sphaerosporella brunnea]|uniref:SGS domain-containing protein n=1 Tax=Sphaerosporella brunnea TaxID=1250544 RepID=A0A5J5F6Y7_9PEZI|nr:SGS domain-containing protein [Sphaerosporella brunnea]
MASYTSLGDQALKAFNASNYSDAITYYTQALELNPEVPDYYLKRSTSYQRSGQYELALHDAELAVVLANKRGKREMIGSAQMRRGIALHLLGRYGDAGFCFDAAEKRVGEKEKNMLAIWRKKLELALEKLDEDDVNREVTILEFPQVEIPKPKQVQKAEVDKEAEEFSLPSPPPESAPISTVAPPAPSASSAPIGVVTPANKIRHEWYQTGTHVVMSLFVKGVPKDKAVVEITDKNISISFPLPTGADFTFDIDPLWDSIIPAESKYNILSTKVELKLLKATPGKKWAALEGAPEVIVKPTENQTTESASGGPAYPTSSKKGAKDWDKLARDLAAKKKDKGTTKEEVEEAGLDYDSDEGDPVNAFFKKLYKDADEDTRRAMMKSYIESNGTALSTNWAEVGRGKVATSPPEGMTAKKWGE